MSSEQSAEMRSINRGDVPAPHVAPGAGKNAADPGEDVVFDAGSLSFIQDWVDGADGQEAIEPEPERNDPRQSNPNRRLGVGAQPKKSKEKQVRKLQVAWCVGSLACVLRSERFMRRNLSRSNSLRLWFRAKCKDPTAPIICNKLACDCTATS